MGTTLILDGWNKVKPMARSVSFRQSLMWNLVLVIVLLGGAIMATTFVGSRRAMRTLSGSLTHQTIEQTEDRLRRFFDPVARGLYIAKSWGEWGLLDTDRPDELTHLFLPLMKQFPQISSILVMTMTTVAPQ